LKRAGTKSLVVAAIGIAISVVSAAGASDAQAPHGVDEVVHNQLGVLQKTYKPGDAVLVVKLPGRRVAIVGLTGNAQIRIDERLPAWGRSGARVFEVHQPIVAYGRTLFAHWMASDGTQLENRRITPHAALIVGEGFSMPDERSDRALAVLREYAGWTESKVLSWGHRPGTTTPTPDAVWLDNGVVIPIRKGEYALVTTLVEANRLSHYKKRLRKGAHVVISGVVKAVQGGDSKGRPVTGTKRKPTHWRVELDPTKIVIRDKRAGELYAIVGEEPFPDPEETLDDSDETTSADPSRSP
jgi:hypothetical protein